MSHTVSLYHVKSLRFSLLRGKSFIIVYPSKLIGVRFPAQGIARSDAKVPSVLYYDKSSTLRAAGAEVFKQDIVEAALSEGWTRAEWLVIRYSWDSYLYVKFRWKLHLCLGRLTATTNDIPPLPSGKSSVMFSRTLSSTSSSVARPTFGNAIPD